MSLAHPSSLSRTLTRMNLLVSGAALLLACGAFAAYDLLSFRELLVRDLSIQAQIAGSNCVSAILFNDAQTATDTLASLRASPQIISAQVYKADGSLLATYWRTGVPGPDPPSPALAEGQDEVITTALDGLTLARRITFESKHTGSIAIQSSIDTLYERLQRYLILVGFVLLVSLLTALAVSGRAQRAISRPLIQLAELAQRVSDSEDYTLRGQVQTEAPHEVLSLVGSFNEMLERIQARDRSLQQARDELEDRVRRRTAELKAANDELEAFTYSVSHDLRAPLRHVVGFATLLEQSSGPALDDRGRRHLSTITNAANRMARLIDDLLAFSRMGRASLSPRPVPLEQMVREARAEIAPEIGTREIDWVVHPLPEVYADPALLRPAMINLLSNAAKYSSTRPKAVIEIGTVPGNEGETVVFVRDNGVGFDMQYANKLFGVFQRLHRADEFSGTGIGLANVRRIIHRHGGRTWAEGALGVGATFYFSLPAAPAASVGS